MSVTAMAMKGGKCVLSCSILAFGLTVSFLVVASFLDNDTKCHIEQSSPTQQSIRVENSSKEEWPRENSSKEEWPSPAFWKKIARIGRTSNQCAYASCPLNRSSERIDSSKYFSSPLGPEFACPFYFNYIHEDLLPWRESGISKDMLDNATVASFRVVIKNGRIYAKAFESCFQTRAVFSIWGLLQLIDYYPGVVPDVDMLFACEDKPRVPREKYKGQTPPPLFSYCSTPNDFDVPFPDWSFWGWPEVRLKPWDEELSGILKGQNARLWEQRHARAFWKGNTGTGGALRRGLQHCNGDVAEIIHQDWGEESRTGYRNSRLSEQCKNKYKIYVEGRGWSVSLKYILACDSPVLLVDPTYHDFFSRGLMPMEHFWPIRPKTMCESIKFAVQYGNNNTMQAELLGRRGRQFVTRDVSMKSVYDYMLHILRGYSKLLRFEPNPEGFTELCAETFLCQAPAEERPYYESSRVVEPSDDSPCFLGQRDANLVQQHWRKRLDNAGIVQEAEDKLWSGGDPSPTAAGLQTALQAQHTAT